MRYLRYLALLGIFMLTASYSKAQVSVGIGVGPGYGYVGAAPVCSYGYYDYYPYACAPYGFYGPDYFVGGVFIGAGPWYRGYYGRGGYGYYGRGRGYARGYSNDPLLWSWQQQLLQRSRQRLLRSQRRQLWARQWVLRPQQWLLWSWQRLFRSWRW